MALPNVRKIFIPDRGKVIVDADLSGADAMVVAAEAEDTGMLADMRAGIDIHSKNATDIWGSTFTALSPTERRIRRGQCKIGVHATNYGASARTLASNPAVGWPLRVAEDFQRRWFDRHPGIKAWHTRTSSELLTKRTIRNRFGYRIVYFDRIDVLLPQALAWTPQSTVAEVCFRGALRLRSEYPWAEILLNVHDSIVFQIPTHRHSPGTMEEIAKVLEVPVPYPEPLVIPWKVKASEKSWGDCE